MSAIARVTLDGAQIRDDSTVTILEDGLPVCGGPVPLRVEHGGRLAPARICAALASLGYRPIDYYNQRLVPGGIELDVERA